MRIQRDQELASLSLLFNYRSVHYDASFSMELDEVVPGRRSIYRCAGLAQEFATFRQ